ncbi:transcriptional regulator [Desulfovibrio cuneatus]|uniref:transcriptional regulator n=1 Tax=Desulfovibrio cuneatus TaxID=159728 RepID=UPI0004160A03|nr:transcriptional regulator [Desulfovibrio cuneatus]
MTKWIIIALAIFVLYKLITNEKGKKEKSETKAKERKIAAGKMVKDPICGTYVEVDSSISVRDGNATHRFCSYECRQAYLDKLEASGRDIPSLEQKDEDD